MEHEQMIQNLKEEIELLARMHLLYGMVHTHLFEEKKTIFLAEKAGTKKE